MILKTIYLFIFIFFIFNCGSSGVDWGEYEITFQGNSKDVEVEFSYYDNKGIFSGEKKRRKVKITDEEIKSTYSTETIHDYYYHYRRSSSVPWLVENIYLKYTSSTITNFKVTFREKKDDVDYTYYFTNQNITFDKGKLILDGVETKVIDYKYKN